MDIARPDIKQKKRKKQIALGIAGGVVVLLGVLGLSRIEPAAPSVDKSSVWMDKVKREFDPKNLLNRGRFVYDF